MRFGGEFAAHYGIEDLLKSIETKTFSVDEVKEKRG